VASDFPRGVSIVGLGLTDVGKVYGRTPNDFAAEAVRLAVAEAGLTLSDVDGLLITDGLGDQASIFLQRDLNLRDIPLMMNVGTWGTAPGVMLETAAMAISTGQASTVVCVMGSAPMRDPNLPAGASFANATNSKTGWSGMKDANGGSPGINLMAMMARRHMNQYGWERDALGHIAVSTREWALKNPVAQMKKSMTMDDYLASRWVAEPFRVPDCCVVTNGGVAFVVTSTERAKDLAQPPVPLLGISSVNPGFFERRHEDYGLVSGAAVAGPQALKMAGVSLEEIDAVQIYDCFTFAVLITLEDLGFAKKGEGADFVSSGVLGPNGTFPLNTGGGLLSAWYFTGFGPIYEAVTQARGTAGERQLAKSDLILATNNGGSLDQHTSMVFGSSAAA